MYRKYLLGFLLFFPLLSCTNEGQAPGGGQNVLMPYVTGAVSGNSSSSTFSSLSAFPMATTGVPLNAQSCPGCGSNMTSVFSLASIFAIQGKFADANSCTIAAVVGADVIPDLTSGEYKYLNTGIQLKVRLTMDGDTVTSFDIHTCSEGTQVQYIGGTNTDGNVTFKFRSKDPSGTSFVVMDAEGVLDGSSWSSKDLEVGMYFTSSGSYSHYIMNQNADYIDFQGVVDTGTLGTLDSADVQLVARAQLLGNSLKTYALGDGSIRVSSGGGGAINSNWNADTKAEGSGPTTYDAVVASATLPSVPSTRVNAFTTDELWDCTMTDPINLFSVASPQLMASAMACEEDFQ